MGEFENVQLLSVTQRRVRRNILPNRAGSLQGIGSSITGGTDHEYSLTQKALGIGSRSDRCAPTFHCHLSEARNFMKQLMNYIVLTLVVIYNIHLL